MNLIHKLVNDHPVAFCATMALLAFVLAEVVGSVLQATYNKRNK